MQSTFPSLLSLKTAGKAVWWGPEVFTASHSLRRTFLCHIPVLLPLV